MALCALRCGLRPSVFQHAKLLPHVSRMGTSAEDEMREFWQKNQAKQRPMSPWIVYKWELPMLTSAANRITGVTLTAGLYVFAVGVFATPEAVPHYIDALKALELGPAFWLPAKTLAALPLTFHAFNGLRHVGWDFYRGTYEVTAQLKSGTFFTLAAVVSAVALASISYAL